MKVAALAGGVGGAKLLVGLQALPEVELTAIVNTGDDAEIYGVHVSPDLDIVTYWLAGLADLDRGWGISGDTWTVVDGLAELGAEAWFRLGDRDFATCVYRTERLRQRASLTIVTDEIRRGLGVSTRLLPMSDDPVRTMITTEDGTRLEFQEYFVRDRQKPLVAAVSFEGLDDAKPAPGILDALRDADVVVLCPSNPVVSLGPILALPGVRETLVAHPRVVAVTPIVKGAPLKGPADKLLRAVGREVSASGVAGIYADFCKLFVVDASDPGEVARVEAIGIGAMVADTIMTDLSASERVARAVLEAGASLA